MKNSGVAERYRAENETNTSLGVQALQQALQNAGLKIHDIDFLISASVTYDYLLPHQSSNVLREFDGTDEPNIPTMDINSSCLSFVSALNMAAHLLAGKQFRNIAIVSAEISSKGLNPANRETATLFGDGAAAAIVTADKTGISGIIKADMKTYSEGFDYSMIRGGGNRYYFSEHPYDAELYSFYMHGKHLLKLAWKRIPEYFTAFFSDLDRKMEDIELIVLHPASKMGLNMFRKVYDLKDEQVYVNLEKNGNCISASIPMALHEVIESGRLQRGDEFLIAGTAAGFAIGSILLRF